MVRGQLRDTEQQSVAMDRWSVRRCMNLHAAREGVFGALMDKHWDEWI